MATNSTVTAVSTTASAVEVAVGNNINEFWKDDFGVLESAGKVVLQALRDDEAAPDADLYRRINSSMNASGASHLYFCRDYHHHQQEHPGPAISALPSFQHVRSIPMPELLREIQASAAFSYRMGLLPEANMAWMSVDHRLYLWSYEPSLQSFAINHVPDFCWWQNPSGQPILTVTMVTPTKGIFSSVVERCLVVTTTDQVLLCLLVRDRVEPQQQQQSEQRSLQETGFLRILTSKFVLNVGPIWAVAATRTGRIFLGGKDGNMYEMVYSLEGKHPKRSKSDLLNEELDVFYDGQTNSLKRSHDHVGGPTQDESSPPPRKKSRKVDHSSGTFTQIATAFVPPLLVQAAGALFSSVKSFLGGSNNGPIKKIVIDEERSCLYTLTTTGWIASFDLMQNTFVAAMDTPASARRYLDAVAHGQMVPPSPHDWWSSLAHITFPGGIEAAQAGVGGIYGARSILTLADMAARKSGGREAAAVQGILTPHDLQVIPRKESSRVTLVAISNNGLRYLISSLAKKVVRDGPSPYLGADRGLDPLAPSSHFTLCHIRAPPSLGKDGRPKPEDSTCNISSLDARNQSGIITLEGETAVTPKVSPVFDQTLDACLYYDGTLVLARNAGRPSDGAGDHSDSGDIIIVASPDSVARMKVTQANTGVSNADRAPSTTQTYEVAGGLAETLFIPMKSTSFRPIATADTNPTLHGGKVWSISRCTVPNNPVLTLSLASQTPTDADLRVGMPPAFIQPNISVPSNRGKKLAFAPPKPGTIARVFATEAIQKIASFIRNRPPYHGNFTHTDLYRISTRFGYDGFSVTAGETPASQNAVAPSNLKSARLRPWLLRPPVVPLNSMAVQHLLPSFKVVALNCGGFHHFQSRSALVSLSETLLSSGSGNYVDQCVTKVFTSYGSKEGCAMCLLLAIGFGTLPEGEAQAPELRNRATTAAFARGSSPRLLQTTAAAGDRLATALHGGNLPDPVVPPGYEFCPSVLFQGVVAVVSRLLRPVWHKPVVVVTEGRPIQRGGALSTTPAKVELLLDDFLLKEVRRPLFELQELMKSKFSKAVATVPGKPESDKKVAMDVDGNAFLTLSMFMNGRTRYNALEANTPYGQLSQAEAEQLARLIEEKNLHAVFRLVNRAVQLLSLLAILGSKAEDSVSEFSKIEWGLLHGVTFAQLVVSQEGHERLERVLNSLVTAWPTNPFSISTHADDLARRWADQCYLYFSPGFRFEFLAFRYANMALCVPSQRPEAGSKALEYFKAAARHWCSAPLVVGGFLHSTEQESFTQKALRAIQCHSPLARATSLLMQLDNVVGIVQICLITASNFGGLGGLDDFSSSSVQNEPATMNFPWERGLYHERRQSQYLGPENEQLATSRLEPSPAAAVGTAVTAQDALQTCHALIYHHLMTLLDAGNQGNQRASSMLSACLASTDTTFLRCLFDRILENNHVEALVSMDSPELEKWLKGRANPDLLFRYYVIHRRNRLAGQVMWNLATNNDLAILIDKRIEYLTRAKDCFHDDEVRDQNLENQVADALDVGKLQQRVLCRFNETGIGLPEDQRKQLSFSLVSVSNLFNDFAFPYQMFDICLIICQTCQEDNASTVQKLWKTVIVQEVLPCATRSEDVYRFLQKIMEGTLLDNKVDLIAESASVPESVRLFERGEWLTKAQNAVINLGKEVYSKDANYFFPVEFIASQLEDMRLMYDLYAVQDASKQNQPWPLRALISVGVPYREAFGAYIAIVDSTDRVFNGEVDSQGRFYHLRAVVELLYEWLSAAKASPGDPNSPMEQLSGALASANFMPLVGRLYANLEALRGVRLSGDVNTTLETLSTVMKQLSALIQIHGN